MIILEFGSFRKVGRDEKSNLGKSPGMRTRLDGSEQASLHNIETPVCRGHPESSGDNDKKKMTPATARNWDTQK